MSGRIFLMSLCVTETSAVTLTGGQITMQRGGRLQLPPKKDGCACDVNGLWTESESQGNNGRHGFKDNNTKVVTDEQNNYCIAPMEIHNSLRNIHKPDNFLDAAYVIFTTLCGASTVAIDNKIEQAMDLVKSHLMFAVREEVEVLKEQIKELLEKNSQLEYENSILKANASPETMSKLQQNNPQPPPPSNS